MHIESPTQSGFSIPRVLIAFLLCSFAAFFAVLSFAANPASGTITPSGPSVSWVGTATGGAAESEGTCVEGINCDTFALTISGNPGDWAGKQVRVSLSWLSPTTDYDMYIHKGPVDGPAEKSSGQGVTTSETAVIDPSTEGTGLWSVHVVYFAANAADQYSGAVTVEASTQGGGCANVTTGGARFQNYTPPDGSGLGGDAGEPTIGVNPATGNVFYIAILQTLRINFDDCTSPAGNTWTDVSFPTTSANTLDPILFTDQVTGRTFVSQLAGKASLTAYTDNDGGTDGKAPGDWTQSQGSGINSGVDHQNLGYGPFAPPLTRDPNGPLYPNAVYYCSQDVAIAQCAVSADGGQTFGPAVPIYNATQCGGLHGHIKVSPVDGAAYVPNKGCGSKQGMARSLNNGATWTVLTVPDSTPGDWDPSIGIGKNGTVYFGYGDENGNAKIAVSRDRGQTWQNSIDVGCPYNISNTAFPVVVAGDDDRAAFAFLGAAPANPQDQIWHLYVATTIDGGATWQTVDATPADPVQRGTICSGGISCGSDRNLLDFMDVEVDAEGRILVAYADGCIGSCVQAPPNSFSALASIARQSGGKRLYAAFDPAEPGLPSSPLVSATRDASGLVRLTWPQPDNGGSPITGYNIYRQTGGTGPFTLVATVTKTKYDDIDAASSPGTTYLYKVTSLNSVGESPMCTAITPVVTPALDPCTLPGVLASNDISDTPPQTPAVPAADVKSIFVAEPFDPANPGANKLAFTLQTGGGALPPNAQWYIIWNRLALAGNGDDRNYVVMKTNAAAAPSFKYGTVSPPSVNLPTDLGDADSGSYDPATGKITIVISNSKIENLGAGQTIGGLAARIFNRGDACPASQCLPVTQSASQDFSPEGSYTLVGNFFCRPNTAPTAVLNATPTSGDVPLLVSFDATSSADSDSPPDTIVNYTFDFGDGEQESGTDPTVQHTYDQPGFYRARLLVTDSRGKVSSNIAQVVIDVGSPLASIVSRKTHASAGSFDINLPTEGPAAVEPRSGGAQDAFTIIYTFDRTITATGTATSNDPDATATVQAGPGGNQVTVNLTGVSNAQHLEVTLNGVQDTAGANLTNLKARVGILFGDSSGDGVVNSGDITPARRASGQPTSASNFRIDVSLDGVINSGDITPTRRASGSALPPQ